MLSALGIGTNVDLLRDAFKADHTGMDAALDLLRVERDPANVNGRVIRNIVDDSTIKDDPNQQETDEMPSTGTSLAQVTADLQAIQARFDAIAALFKNGTPAPNDPTLLDGLADDFMFWGLNKASLLQALASNAPNLRGMQFSEIAIEDYIDAGTVKVRFVITLGNGEKESDEWLMSKVNGVWRFAGNQEIAELGVFARAEQTQDNGIETGLRFHLADVAGQGRASTTPSLAARGCLPAAFVWPSCPTIPSSSSPMRRASTGGPCSMTA